MPKTASDVLAFIKSRPATIPDGYSDAAISSYISEALAQLLAHCNLLQSDSEAVPDDLLGAWAEISTVLMWGGASAGAGKPSQIKEGDTTMSFTAGKFSGSGVVFSALDNFRVMDRYRSMF